MSAPIDVMISDLSPSEHRKRNDLASRKPYVAAKLARIAAMEERGEISPVIRLEKSYLCNFQCTHCSAEYYMDRHLKKTIGKVDERPKITLDDIRKLSQEADEMGLARFVCFRFDRESLQDKIADVLAHPARYVDIGIEVAAAFRVVNPPEAAVRQL